MLIERLPLQEGGLERIAEGADGVGEDMIEHLTADATVSLMSLVVVTRSEGVATLTLNNPEERNTLTAPMVAQIVDAVDALEADDEVGALVVTGAPPAFCAGANLGNLMESTPESLGTIYEGFLRIARCSLPTLAAVNGAAAGRWTRASV